MSGARVLAQHPLAQVMDGMGLNITLLSYTGQLDFGVVADRDTLPEVGRLIPYLQDALDELVALSPDGDVRPEVHPRFARRSPALELLPEPEPIG
jgi:hypothetical protein